MCACAGPHATVHSDWRWKVVQAQACCGNVHPIVAGQLHIFSKCQARSLDWASIHVSKNPKDIECILVYIDWKALIFCTFVFLRKGSVEAMRPLRQNILIKTSQKNCLIHLHLVSANPLDLIHPSNIFLLQRYFGNTCPSKSRCFVKP